MNTAEDSFKLWVFFDDLKVDMFKEFPIYDGLDMIMAVGGVLAFFLGFSLLSVLLDCLDNISRALGNEEELKVTAFRRTLRQ
jgi:hypothetical protein